MFIVVVTFAWRRICFTDTTPTLEGEAWLLRNGYTQAEGVANLDQVPEKGALVAIGFPKLQGGTGGYARFIAICPPDWKYGVSVQELPEAPLKMYEKPLHGTPTPVCAFDKRRDHMYIYHRNFLQKPGFPISSTREGGRGCVFPSGRKG